MGDYRVEALNAHTWDAYARMMERHNGVFGGCWCTYFHTMAGEKTYDAGENRALKQRLVEEGRSHAALVMDGDEAVAWAQFGSPQELPNIYHRKEYEMAGDAQPTSGSPASSSTRSTGGSASPRPPYAAHSTSSGRRAAAWSRATPTTPATTAGPPCSTTAPVRSTSDWGSSTSGRRGCATA